MIQRLQLQIDFVDGKWLKDEDNGSSISGKVELVSFPAICKSSTRKYQGKSYWKTVNNENYSSCYIAAVVLDSTTLLDYIRKSSNLTHLIRHITSHLSEALLLFTFFSSSVCVQFHFWADSFRNTFSIESYQYQVCLDVITYHSHQM